MVKERTNRNILAEVILSQYFENNTISNVEEIKGDYYSDIQTQLFNEPKEEYIECKHCA